MWRLQGSGAIFVCWVSVKLRLLFTAGPYWQVVSARCAVWIFIDLWNLRPQNACSLSFLRPALKICVKNADFCVNANPAYPIKYWINNVSKKGRSRKGRIITKMMLFELKFASETFLGKPQLTLINQINTWGYFTASRCSFDLQVWSLRQGWFYYCTQPMSDGVSL